MLSRGKRSGTQTFFVVSLALLFIVISTGIGYLLFEQIRDAVASSTILPEFFPGEGSDEPSTEPIVVLEPWQGGRMNVLLLGVDERESEQGPWRTDTMIVLTIDSLTHTGGILSIPRDLWVPIPGYSMDRINTANWLGDAYDYPGGGPALAMRTVQNNLGVPIHYYVRLNFRGFVEMVDTIGGIDIYVEEEINDPYYPSSDPADPYGFEHLYIPAGMVHMDGELTLKYARTRHSAGGDFDRALRQQQVMQAILERVTRFDLLPQLLPQAVPLWQTMSDSIETDLTLDQIVALAALATEIPPENIRTAVIGGPPHTQFHETPEGEQVLVPVREHIRELIEYIFTVNPAATGDEDLAVRLAEEAATVEIQNGTATPGLAQSSAEYLEEQGIQVVSFDNADRFDYAVSLIYVYTGKTFTAETIAEILGLPPTAVVLVSNPQAETDIVVILGADYQPPEVEEVESEE